MSQLEDAVEDAILQLAESGTVLPPKLTVRFTDKEWELVERFHRLRIVDEKPVFVEDRYPFVDLTVLGIDVRLTPFNPLKDELSSLETIH